MPLLDFVLAGAAYLDPMRDHAVISEVIANVVQEELPLFRDDQDRQKTAALVLAVAWREGSLGLRVLGDCTESKAGAPCRGAARSFCTLQVHASSGGSPALNDDPSLCIRTGLAMLRTSMRVCAAAPVAFYAAGPGSCENARALRISADRMRLASRVRAAAVATLAAESST